MANQVRGRALWHRRNTGEQGLVLHHPRYADIINNKRPALTKIVQPAHLWSHLRKYGVLDKDVQEELTRPTREQTVEQLLDHVECGPSWRLHAFLRACSLTHQTHVVSCVGLEEDTYRGPSPPESESEDGQLPGTSTDRSAGDMTGTKRQHGESFPELQQPGKQRDPIPLQTQHPGADRQPRETPSTKLEHRLKYALMVHCDSYQQLLMVGKVFDFKHSDPQSDMYDIDECYIHQDVDFERYKRVVDRIKMRDILKKYGRFAVPRTVLLVGPPGAGKSTFFKRIAFCWSQEFLQYIQQRGLLDCPDLKLVVYIPARTITPDIWKTIEDELCCEEDDKGIIMKEVKSGQLKQNSAFLVDGIDEIRDDETLLALRNFIDSRHKHGGPQILVSARTGLSRIDNYLFNRFLGLDGFTVQQGLEYTSKYITLHSKEGSYDTTDYDDEDLPEHNVQVQRKPPVVNYIHKHKERFAPILSNPLRAHILSGLAVEGLVKLNDDNIINSVKLLSTMESFFTKRETEGKGVSVDEQNRFYKLCLYGILENIREFTQDHLQKFNVQESAYLAFFKRFTKKNRLADNVIYYSFEHEILNEFFAARGIETVTSGKRDAILLHVCSRSILRNLQKLIFGILGEYGTDKTVPMLIGMTRLILVQEALNEESDEESTNDIHNAPDDISEEGSLEDSEKLSSKASEQEGDTECQEFMSSVEDLLKDIAETIPEAGALLLEEDDVMPRDEDAVLQLWEKVNTTFDTLTTLTTRNKSPYDEDYWAFKYFTHIDDAFLKVVILDFLTECPPEHRLEIAKNTYFQMLPSYSVYPCNHLRWADISLECIRAWSPRDITEGIMQRAERSPEKETTDTLYIDFNYCPTQWGQAPEDHWTRAAWGSALRVIRTQFDFTDEVEVGLAQFSGTPLMGLLDALTNLDTSDYPGASVKVSNGDISLEDLHNWYQVSCDTHKLKFSLHNTTLHVPDDEQTMEKLLQWLGTEMSQEVKARIETAGHAFGSYDECVISDRLKLVDFQLKQPKPVALEPR